MSVRPRWLPAPAPAPAATTLARELGVSQLLAQCLVNRGFLEPTAATGFLHPRLRHLDDPAGLPELPAAVARLWRAHQDGEAVVIFGDYDVDGVTATALLLETLRALGWRVHHYLPHRLDEGYGLTREAVENCLEQQPASLLLAVDCGSSAHETIAWLRQRGVEVIVLDHHQVGRPLPVPIALVNPQLGAAGRELCSAGLAFKLAHALVKRGREAGLPEADRYDLRPLLDLVALGTIADLAPLVGENRILVTAGLERLSTGARPGLAALRDVAQVASPIGTYEVGFQLAPRLNAAGRLEHAADALNLLLASERGQAERLARGLDERNRERQRIERAIAEEVLTRLRQRFDPAREFAIVEGDAAWHVGVVGIVASRVLTEFYRPTIILGGDGAEWRGSGRSIEGFDLAAALHQCGDLLVRHGGHAMAAGVTLRPEHVPAFRARLSELARGALAAEALRPTLRLDAEVSLADLTLGALDALRQLEPHGQGNPSVQVLLRCLQLRGPPTRMGREQQHVRLRVAQDAATAEAVWWRGGDKPWPGGPFDLACVPQLNHYNGRTTVQLKVLDWRPSQT